MPTLTLDQIYLGHPVDRGCKIATQYLNHQSLCSECPFPQCIKDIHPKTRLLLKNSILINQIFEASKQGLSVNKISNLFNDISLWTIQYYIRHKKRIQKTLINYSWVLPYIN